MEELVVNLHMHTPFSDGFGTHRKIGQSALKSGLDAVIVTDHNVLVKGVEDYFEDGERRTLLLVGEEIHDQARDPQKNHLLVFNTQTELAQYAPDPQKLINAVRADGGFCFIAHPYDPEMPAFGETDISWEAWEVDGYTGLEIWNGLSELKTVARNKLQAVFYALFPQHMAHQPLPAALEKWDELLSSGRRVAVVGGSDAHALPMHMGPLHRTIFPYEFHFSAINTHILTEDKLSGEITTDREMIYTALRSGNYFVGYDLPASTRGFRFSAQGREQTAAMGGEIRLNNGVTLQIRLPRPTYTRLIQDGKIVKTWGDRQVCSFTATEPGAYRVEAYIPFLGKQRGWIFSNPIYIR